MTYDQCVTLTTLISAAQGTSFAEESKLQVWYSLLGDLDFDRAHLALKKLLRTEKYTLTPAHIRRACTELDADIPMTVDAIKIINQAVSEYGMYRTAEAVAYIERQNPIVGEIVRSIGFRQICMGNDNFVRPELERLYIEAVKAKMQDDALPQNVKLAISKFRDKLEFKNLLAISCDSDYEDVS